MIAQNTEKDLDNLRKLSYFYYFSEALHGLLLFVIVFVIGISRFYFYLGAFNLTVAYLDRGVEGLAVSMIDDVGAIVYIFPSVLVVGTVFGLLALAGLVSGYFAGKFQRERKHHTFCMLMAGLTATSIPIGTAIGIPTFILLLREPVKKRFDETATQKIEQSDRSKLRLLSNLYQLYGVVSLVFLLPPVLYTVALAALVSGGISVHSEAAMFPWMSQTGALAAIALGSVCSFVLSVCTILTGRWIKREKAYIFCIVISALISLFAPFGTILGIWSLFLLFSDPVRTAFRTNKAGGRK